VPRNPSWNGFRSRKALRSSPALMKHGSSNFCWVEAAWTASAEQSCNAKLYHQWAAGQLSPAPTAIGATPETVLSLVISALRSSNVVGGAVMPAWVKTSLLYQKPSTPKLYGRPYCLPSTDQILAAAPMLATSGLTRSVRSLREPAGSCSNISPT